MSRQEFKPLTWTVKNFDVNAQQVKDYDVLMFRENAIKDLKKKCIDKEMFEERLRNEMMWQYWSRAEYELIIEIDDNNHIWLIPWCGCLELDKVKIDVADDDNFDWRSFAELHIGKQIYRGKAKIDVWDQILYQWPVFVDYVWNYRHKYQRAKRNTAE